MKQEMGKSELERLLEAGEAVVFSEENYGGQQQLITTDTPDVKPDFPITSIQIGPQTGVTLFSEKNYQGLSQELTTDLASMGISKLKDIKIQSLKIWSTVGKPFTGYWAIEVEDGRYLSVGPDGVLTTSQKVRERETFRITKIDPKQGTVALTVGGAPLKKAPTVEQPPSITIDDLQNVGLHNEPEAGFRKFSLMTADNHWIHYDPDKGHFLTTTDQKDRKIFYQAIKIAENETQVGELSVGEVALYENKAYWGKAWVFCTDCADFSKVAGLNEKVSSIQLGPQTGVTIYSEPQFNIGTNNPKAAKQDVTSNLSSLELQQVSEDQISSMGMWKIVSPEGTGISFTCSLSQDFRGSGKTFQEYSAYRTTLRLPLKAKNVDLWTTDETDIEVNGTVYRGVSEDQPVSLPTISTKSLVITTDAAVSPRGGSRIGSLSAVGLKVRTDTMLPHERIVIFPDQPVHERLANLEDEEDKEDENKDTLWNATYVTYEKGKRTKHHVIKDRSVQKKTDVTNAQSMITKIASTVKYSSGASGGLQRTISPEALQGKAWALDFLTYRVTAETLYVREAPDPKSRQVGYLRKNDVVEVLGFNVGAGWIRIRRPADGLTGWSSSTYLSQIPETPSQGEQYRVTATALHVRRGPGVEFSSLGYIRHDELVTAIGVNDKGTWRKIVTSEGRVGWSSARYMTLVHPPPPEPPPLVTATFRGIRPVDQEVAPLKMPLPAVSELAPQVRFREISQEQIQALLARAESPETKLAQDILSDIGDAFESIGDAFESAGSFIINAFEEVVEFVIDIGGHAIKWIVDTAEKAIAVVEGIIKKIGAVIEEIIKWLRFLFEWGDILDTRDYLRKSILNALDIAGQTLPKKAEGLVREFFEDKKDLITDWFEKAIRELDPSSSTGTSSGGSSGGVQMPDELDWILSKVLGGIGALGGSGSFSINFSHDLAAEARLQRLWDDTLGEGAEKFSKVLKNLQNIITSLVENLDDPRKIMASLLRLFRDILDGFLEMGEKIVLDLLELAGFLCQLVKAVLNMDLYIPLISELLNWIGNLLDVDLTCSIIDIATLILAIPVTVICKAAFGEAPFKNAPALALGVQEEAYISALGIVSGVANCVGALLSIPLDIKPEMDKAGKTGGLPQSWFENDLELLCFTISLESAVAGWTAAGLEGDSEDESEASKVIKWILLGYDVVIMLADTGNLLYGLWRSPKKFERFKRGDNVTIWIASAAGLFHLGLLIAKSILDKNVKAIPDCLMTLPEIGSALRLSKNLELVAWGFGLIDATAAGAAIASIVLTAEDA